MSSRNSESSNPSEPAGPDQASPRFAPEVVLDAVAARQVRNWSRGELVARACWGLAQPLFRFSPRILWGWRRFLLRLFGARIGRHVHVHPTVKIFAPWNLQMADFGTIGDGVRVYNLGPVTMGHTATLSQGAHLCAGSHDYSRPDLPLIKGGIVVEDGAWVCADAFVGPDVTVGDHAIVGARSVVMHDVPPWGIMAGNPARMVGKREAPV